MEIIKEKRRSELVCLNKLYKKSNTDSAYHWHENIEVCFIKRGDFSFFADGEYINADTGDIVTFGEYSVHRFMRAKGFRDIYICQFPVSILIGAGVTLKPVKTHITADEIKAVPGLVTKLNNIFNMLLQEQRSEKSEENPFFRTMMASLYFLLMKYFPGEETKTVNKRERQEFYRITEYINSHFAEDINVSDIADALCISRGKASDIFAKYAEVSINAYINSLRINYSNELLRSGYSISDAAFESGFSSIRTFNNAYKRETGKTPTEYLKNNQE